MTIGSFRALHAGGLFVEYGADVTALSLLFDKVVLPDNLSVIDALASRYELTYPGEGNVYASFESSGKEVFGGLPNEERQKANAYLARSIVFALHYRELFGPVFESDLLADLVVDGPQSRPTPTGELVPYVTFRGVCLHKTDDSYVQAVKEGCVPVVTSHREIDPRMLRDSALGAATLLAMRAVKIALPATRPASAEDILTARHKLRDDLPPFWSVMLKLTVQLKEIIKSGSAEEFEREAQWIVDTMVRPAVIDLQAKLESERKLWAYRILSPVQKALRLLVGNPPITQQQLISSALVLGADAAMAVAENIRTIDALKREAGLTFLLRAAEELKAG